MILGTPAYLAPEQVRGQAIDERADLYAVGVILFEALTRRLPFVGADFDVMSAHVGRPPPSMRSILGEAVIPEAIEEVVSRGARRAPINPNDAADQSFVPGHPPGSRPVSDHSRPRHRRSPPARGQGAGPGRRNPLIQTICRHVEKARVEAIRRATARHATWAEDDIP